MLISTFKDLIFGWRNWFLYIRQTMRNPELVKKELEEKAKKEAHARAEAGQSNSASASSPSETGAADNVYSIEGSLNAIGAVTSRGASASAGSYVYRTEETTLASSFKLSLPKVRETRDAEVQLDEGELGKRRHRPDKRGFRIDDLHRFGGPRKKKTLPPPAGSGAEDTAGNSSNSNSNSNPNPNSNSSAVSVPDAQASSPSSPEVATEAEPETVADTQLSSVSTVASVSSNATSNATSNLASRAERVPVAPSTGFSNPVFSLESRRPERTTSPLAADAFSPLPPSYNSVTRPTQLVDGSSGVDTRAGAALPEWQAALLESEAASAVASGAPRGARSSLVAAAPGLQSDASFRGSESIEMASGSPPPPPASQLRQRTSPRD